MSIFSPVQSFLKSSALKLAALDGKHGISSDDFEVLARRAALITNRSPLDATPEKRTADSIKEALLTFGSDIPAWTVEVIVWLAYQFAKRKGWVL